MIIDHRFTFEQLLWIRQLYRDRKKEDQTSWDYTDWEEFHDAVRSHFKIPYTVIITIPLSWLESEGDRVINYSEESLREALLSCYPANFWHHLSDMLMPKLLDMAAAQRFWTNRPEDEAATVMRQAYHDLEQYGHFRYFVEEESE